MQFCALPTQKERSSNKEFAKMMNWGRQNALTSFEKVRIPRQSSSIPGETGSRSWLKCPGRLMDRMRSRKLVKGGRLPGLKQITEMQ
jgi:hypothetical protein